MWPRYVTYRERLSPDSLPIEVELPQSRHDAFDLLHTLDRLARDDRAAWQATYRQYATCDWYVLAFLLSGTQRMDPFTGRPEWDCDFQFQWAREMQFDGDNTIDKSAREHGKSSWRCYVGVINELLRDPNLSIGIFAFEKAAAERQGRRVKDELATNIELKAAFPDVLYDDPDRESPLWSMEKGIVVRRTIISATPSLGWYSILELPTGSRFGLGILDDCETERTVSTEEMRRQTSARVQNAFNLAGRACRWVVNGTHHHSQGLIAELEGSGGWRVRCHAAEDETREPPDIAALYDACGGSLPVREEFGRAITLPPEVRDIRLSGAPVYLHPLECALKRLRQGHETYTRQNMGDALAGQQKRLDIEWIRYYDATPHEWARGSNLYVVIDPSKGVGDPTFARVEACKADQTISWVGGLRKKLAPSEFGPAVFQLAMEWANVGRLIEIRVEEFAQSVWSHLIREEFKRVNASPCRVVACSRHNSSNRESEGRRREWTGLEPLYRGGRRLYPKDGIHVFDEVGKRFDLVDYYVRKEYGLFPIPVTDDGLAADYLLAVTRGKNEAGREIDLALEFPETDEMMEAAERSWGPASRNEDTSWMSGEWAYN